MSEEQPQAEVQEKNPAETAPQVDETTTALGEVAVQDAEVVPVTDSAWDHDKAQAMANVMQTAKSYYSPEHGTILAAAVKDTLATNQENEQLKTTIDSPGASDTEREHAKDLLEYNKNDGVLLLENDLAPYLELYESNPERYAEMPTPLFINEAKAYDAAKENIYAYDSAKRKLKTLADGLFNSLPENGSSTPPSNDDFLSIINLVLDTCKDSNADQYTKAQMKVIEDLAGLLEQSQQAVESELTKMTERAKEPVTNSTASHPSEVITTISEAPDSPSL